MKKNLLCNYAILVKDKSGKKYYLCENCNNYFDEPCTPETQGCMENEDILAICNNFGCGCTNYESEIGKNCNFCKDGIYIRRIAE